VRSRRSAEPFEAAGGGRIAAASAPKAPLDARAPDAVVYDVHCCDQGTRPHLSALVERVFLPVSGEPRRCVAFSAVGTGARSGGIVATVADLLAQQTSGSVCLVDANFSAPSLHTCFGVPNAIGLADLAGTDDPLVAAARPLRRNLWLVSAGLSSARPSFTSDHARVRIEQLIADFDYLLVDVEPITATGHAPGLAPLVGGVILVVAAESTRRDAARRASRMLHGSGAAVIGAVLTNRRFPIPDALYRWL
jgi:protein-tyrosine kinase